MPMDHEEQFRKLLSDPAFTESEKISRILIFWWLRTMNDFEGL
jgi:hypothetical protein